MKNTILIFVSALIAVSFSACCGDCNGNYLGQFFIQESSKEWIGYVDAQARLFKQNETETAVFVYDFPSYSLNSDVFNCTVDGDCGTCCDDFELEIASLAMTSDDIDVKFNFTIQPDFITKSPVDPPETIDDYLSVSMSGKIFGDLFMDNLTLEDRVILNGVSYRNVFAVELDRTDLDTTSHEPWAFYVTKGKGVVGFKLANGEEWNLQD